MNRVDFTVDFWDVFMHILLIKNPMDERQDLSSIFRKMSDSRPLLSYYDFVLFFVLFLNGAASSRHG